MCNLLLQTGDKVLLQDNSFLLLFDCGDVVAGGGEWYPIARRRRGR